MRSLLVGLFASLIAFASATVLPITVPPLPTAPVHIIAESQGVYADESVFNIGNVAAIFAQSPVTPAAFETLREEALAWFDTRFGLFTASGTFPYYNPATYVTSIQSNANPELNVGNVLGQIFNSNYKVVSSTSLGVLVGSKLSIVEICLYPQPPLVGTPIGGSYGAFIAGQGGNATYQATDSYCYGNYFITGPLGLLDRTLTAKSARPLRGVEGETLLSEELYIEGLESSQCTGQIQLFNIGVFQDGAEMLSNRIENHIFCPGDAW